MTNQKHLKSNLGEVVTAAKLAAISELAKELVKILAEEGFHFDELIEGLAVSAHSQPGWDRVVFLLEDASTEAKKIRKRGK